jgi:enoyl-CoA hydratase/carnithine racemase
MTSSAPLDPAALDRAGLGYEVDGAVAQVTLRRPSTRNSQTPAMWEALRSIGEHLPAEVRVVVVRGEGESFSSGLDRRMLTTEGVDGQSFPAMLALDDDALAARIDVFQQGFTWLGRSDLISVAVVQGHAIGAGFQLALACDLRVLAEDAQLSMREVALGMVPDLTGTKPLVQLVGYSRALEICATTRSVGAEEAYEIGLANVVVPREQLEQTVADLTAALLAPLRGAVSGTKALLQSAGASSAEEQRRSERLAQVRRLRELAQLTD